MTNKTRPSSHQRRRRQITNNAGGVTAKGRRDACPRTQPRTQTFETFVFVGVFVFVGMFAGTGMFVGTTPPRTPLNPQLFSTGFPAFSHP